MTTKANLDTRNRAALALYKARETARVCLNCGSVPGYRGGCHCRASERVAAAMEFDRLREKGPVKRGR
jgi:hypothetical protein